ncbi:MAG TPA: HNH endonuclease signature motif containing protein [Bryobacteraceae bacterium]|nr:HNH endonuclease signature motif containing protein [Bryobacteraceae bacterium]
MRTRQKRSHPKKPSSTRGLPAGQSMSGNWRHEGACAGYVIDHIVPLKRGGADNPENMQWQTKAEATAKDRWE